MGLWGNAGDRPCRVGDSYARAVGLFFSYARRTSVALGVAIVTAGCGSATSGSATSGSATSGSATSGSAPSATALETACGNFFDASVGAGCGGPVRPAAELARERARFVVSCASGYSLPGITITAAFEACAQAMKAAGGCNTVACDFRSPGTLSDGSICASSEQCASGVCTVAAGSTHCGACAAATPVGQSCRDTDCIGPVACAGQPPTCEALTYGGAGAACDSGPNLCAPGLTCNTATATCSPPAGLGEPCDPVNGCNPAFTCNSTTLTCQPLGTVGEPCADDADCASGLGCLPNSKGAMQCGTIVGWAHSTEACDGATRCLVGDCGLPSGASEDTQGTCPLVIADGEPCGASNSDPICDVYAECVNGTCILGAPPSCL
jgi:hypothetical protein